MILETYYFDRDLSWLTFNGRVLEEAADNKVPLGERVNFLSIYSSNLDEFYRVRIPALMALHKIDGSQEIEDLLGKIQSVIDEQQKRFGGIFQTILPALDEQYHTKIIYNQPIPQVLEEETKEYFFTQVAAFIQTVCLDDECDFFPENNKIYFVVAFERLGNLQYIIVNIPSESLGRFYSVQKEGKQYIVFLDDIIRENMQYIFSGAQIKSCHSFKITRDAELELEDEYGGDLAQRIEKQLLKRDMGFATRFLFDAIMPESALEKLMEVLKLKRSNRMGGGRYHNLKDFSHLPLTKAPGLFYEKWKPARFPVKDTIFKQMEQSDFIISPPYQDYNTVLRFFNEAALDEKVEEVYTTIYRMAGDSHIAQALISAAKNKKKVIVFVELKARFDEANNIRWAKRMKEAGVKIIYSIPGWKVHAKVALVKRRESDRMVYYGILGTGNFNERTARIYADHILFTTRKEMLRELELLFLFLGKRKKIEYNPYGIEFKELLVAQFNLFPTFMKLIQDEIDYANSGKRAEISIKLNNLEEPALIKQLYQASHTGVKIRLLVRGICCLVPGVPGMSENIRVQRVVDRYLEHARIFIFYHDGEEKVFMGSSDWMKRNIRRRIEVCFPIHSLKIREQLKKVFELGWEDNVKSVYLDQDLRNNRVKNDSPETESQEAIYQYFKNEP